MVDVRRLCGPALLGAIAAAVLAGCAAPPPRTAAEAAARSRPLEERCQRSPRGNTGILPPGATRESVHAEAEAAARRGELDKACDWL